MGELARRTEVKRAFGSFAVSQFLAVDRNLGLLRTETEGEAMPAAACGSGAEPARWARSATRPRSFPPTSQESRELATGRTILERSAR